MKVSRLIFHSAFTFLPNTNCLQRLKSMQTCILFSILLSQAFQKPENILVLKFKTTFPATRPDRQNRRWEPCSASSGRQKGTRCCFSVCFVCPRALSFPLSFPLVPFRRSGPDTAAALPPGGPGPAPGQPGGPKPAPPAAAPAARYLISPARGN